MATIIPTFNGSTTINDAGLNFLNSNPSDQVPFNPFSERDRDNSQSYSDPTNIVDKISKNSPAPPPSPFVDQRVRLLVPKFYLTGKTGGPKEGKSSRGVLDLNSGIIFPYSPTIEVTHSAEYSEVNALHSNYTQFFYKNSKVSEINVKGKFTCQNEFEAKIILAIIHLGRSLTKMRFGSELYSGSPPPICQLMGYGDYMFDKVPVAVKSFNVEIPNDVDYITIVDNKIEGFGNSSVPVLTEITFELVPMYSKREMLDGTVSGWLTNDSQRLKGYL